MDHPRRLPGPAGRLAPALRTLYGLVTLGWAAMLTATRPTHTAAVTRTRRDGERGDVPGWVMITLMTAGLVIALWAVAGDRLAALFTQAMDAVTKVL